MPEDELFYAVRANWKPISRKNKNIFWEVFRSNHLKKIGYTFLALVPEDDDSFFAAHKAAFKELQKRKKVPEDLEFGGFIPEIGCKELSVFRVYGENLKEDLIIIAVDEDELEEKIGDFKAKIEGYRVVTVSLRGTPQNIGLLIANQWKEGKPIPWRKKALEKKNLSSPPNPPDRQSSFDF